MRIGRNGNGRSYPALIMGLGHPRQTAYLRSLASAGIPVHAVHTERKAQRFSRHLASFHQISTDPDEQLAHLEQFGRDVGGVLIPTNDDYVGLVSRNRERLARHFIIPLPDWDVVGTMFDRARLYAVAQSAGINVPRHWQANTEPELRSIVAALEPQSRDYILKTRNLISAPMDETGRRQTKAAPKQRDAILNISIEQHHRTGHYPLIQEVIPGAADSAVGVSMVVGPGGDIILAYCVRRLRLVTYKRDAGYVHPYELGAVVWCETVHDDEAMDAARAFVKLFKYTGQVTVELRRDPRDGSLHFMKIEPRPVRATSLSRVHRHGHSDCVARRLHRRLTERRGRLSGRSWVVVHPGICRILARNSHQNRRDILRVLRGSRQIKAFGEDFTDPVPLVVGTARVTARPAVRLVRRLLGR